MTVKLIIVDDDEDDREEPHAVDQPRGSVREAEKGGRRSGLAR